MQIIWDKVYCNTDFLLVKGMNQQIKIITNLMKTTIV